jgi:hypothetical protein
MLALALRDHVLESNNKFNTSVDRQAFRIIQRVSLQTSFPNIIEEDGEKQSEKYTSFNWSINLKSRPPLSRTFARYDGGKH